MTSSSSIRGTSGNHISCVGPLGAPSAGGVANGLVSVLLVLSLLGADSGAGFTDSSPDMAHLPLAGRRAESGTSVVAVATKTGRDAGGLAERLEPPMNTGPPFHYQ